MTREELIERVAREMGYIDGVSPENYKSLSQVAVDTIFDALKEPTEDMVSAGNEYGAFIGAYGIWKDMLSASPLAPEE